MRPFADADLGADLTCLLGIWLSSHGVLSAKARTDGDMLALWGLYTTMRPDDPPFLHDAGFAAVLMAPPHRGLIETPIDRRRRRYGLVVARWLLFTVLFESGAGKLLGGDARRATRPAEALASP